MFFIENNGDRATKEEKYRMWPSWQGGVAKQPQGPGQRTVELENDAGTCKPWRGSWGFS